MPNTHFTIPNRSSGWPPVVDIYKNYRFVITFESTTEPGYVSEKLVTALAGGSIPVYYGDGDAARTMFPNLDFIDVHDIWRVTGHKYGAEKPSALHWQKLFEYLIGLDNQKYCLDKCRNTILRRTTNLPSNARKLVPFPSQALDLKTVKVISKKISRSVDESAN